MRAMSLSFLMLITFNAHAEVITVDDDGKADFNSIQAAVEYAAAGDEILVAPGVYTSDHPLRVVDMLGKPLTLRGSGENDPTIIDGESVRRGIVCLNEETAKTVIEGITIRNGVGVEHDFDLNGTDDWWESSGGWHARQTGRPDDHRLQVHCERLDMPDRVQARERAECRSLSDDDPGARPCSGFPLTVESAY